MDSLDKHVLIFCEHGQLKGWPPHFEPTVAKNSISTILHFLVALVTWKHGADIARCHNKSPNKIQSKRHELLGSSEDSKFGYRKFTAKDHSKSSLIHNSNIDPDDVRAGLWLATQFSTLLPPLWSPNELSVFVKKNSRNAFLKQTCRTNLFAAVSHILQTCAAERLAVPKT